MSSSLRVNIVERRSTPDLKDKDHDRRPDTAGSTGSCSWFISSGEQQLESQSPPSGTQTVSTELEVKSSEKEEADNSAVSGSSLLEKYKENKISQQKPRAFFIPCDEIEVPAVSSAGRRRSTPRQKVELKVFELDKNGENHAMAEGDLQEALRKRRPDYIERTKVREGCVKSSLSMESVFFKHSPPLLTLIITSKIISFGFRLEKVIVLRARLSPRGEGVSTTRPPLLTAKSLPT